MGRVAGKVAIVTGAAQGLGRAAAEMLAREGAAVMVTDINEAGAGEVAAGIEAAGHKAAPARLDVSDEAAWQAVIARTQALFGGLDVLVNNAGIALQKNVEDTTLEEWRRLMAVDLDGVYLGTKHGIGAMKARGEGSIVNISSIEGIVAHPELAAYNAAKGGVTVFTKSAALHCGKIGTRIRVNSIHPAFARTPLLDEYIEAREDPAATLAELESLHPIGFLGHPDDVAYGVLYLAADESRWVTGSELVIDGGFTAR